MQEIEDKNTNIPREFERLNGLLRSKDQELASWELRIRQITTERDQFRLRSE